MRFPPSAAPHSLAGWVFSVPRLVFSLPVVFPFPRLVFSVPVVFLVPRSWCFQFLDWCFSFPPSVLFFLVPTLGVFPSRSSPPQVCVFSVPGLLFSLPSSCVGVFGSQVWVFSVLDNVFPAAPVLVCPFTCLFVSFRLNFWLPLPTAGFESTYSCHTSKQTKNTAKPSKPFAVKTCQFA